MSKPLSIDYPPLYAMLWAALRALFVAGVFSTTLAHADEYADVNRLVRAGQLAEAMVKADNYLASKPRDPQMRFLKGVIQTESGKPAEAITTFSKITEDYPELPEPYNNLAVLYASQNQYDKARAALEMAIRTNPSYATAHENLGDVYAKLASQAYSKALQLDSKNAAVQPKLALIRNLFSPEAKGQKPVATASTLATKPAATPAAAPLAKPIAPVAVPAASKPAPASSGPSTPTAAAPTAAALSSAAAAAGVGQAEPAIEAAVNAWAAAWAGQDMKTYLASYAKNFAPQGKQSRSAWEAERRQRIVGKANISVKISNLNLRVEGNKASAKFKQDYVAGALDVSSRKTLEMVKVGERWLIVREATGG